MSDLEPKDRDLLEQIFDMNTGYVLDFSNRTFQEFIQSTIGVDIMNEQYAKYATSKAARLRRLWDTAGSRDIGRLTEAMLIRADGLQRVTDAQRSAATEIVARMKAAPVIDLSKIVPSKDDDAFVDLAEAVRSAVEHGKPQTALDRLHTYLMKYLRVRCKSLGIPTPREKSLHSLMGEYAKALRKTGRLESAMGERILKTAVSTLEAFNDVRNNQSLAHDNKTLSRAEAMLIIAQVEALVQFIDAVDRDPGA